MPAHVLSHPKTAAPESFRERLQIELARRCERNARYSLRAFANFLDIDHATLSQLLRARRPFTASSIRRLGTRIGLSPTEIADHIARHAQATEPQPAPQVKELAADAAAVFADWHAFSILELMKLREFKTDLSWIARMLGADPAAIQIALQHLLRLGFLKMEAADAWVDLTGGTLHREEEFTLLALERLAQRSHSLQRTSARNAPDAARRHGAVTLAVDAQGLAHLLALSDRLLADCRRLAAGATAGTQGDRVYQVEIHCFPISTTEPPACLAGAPHQE